MAIEYVGGQVAGRANPSSGVSVNFALTGGLASTPADGDLVVVTVVVGSAAGNPNLDVVTPTGYTPLTQLNVAPTTADTSLQVSYKRMGASPDTAVTIPGTTNNAWGEAYSIQVFRGVDSSTPMDATPVSSTGSGTNNRPDPGSITPVTAGAWVVICGGGAAGTGANYVAPANFTTNFLTANGADTTDGTVGSGYWDGWTSGAVNPAAYTGGSVNAANSWCAYILALRPTTSTPETVTVTTDAIASMSGQPVAGNSAVTVSVDAIPTTGQAVQADAQVTLTAAVLNTLGQAVEAILGGPIIIAAAVWQLAGALLTTVSTVSLTPASLAASGAALYTNFVMPLTSAAWQWGGVALKASSNVLVSGAALVTSGLALATNFVMQITRGAFSFAAKAFTFVGDEEPEDEVSMPFICRRLYRRHMYRGD